MFKNVYQYNATQAIRIMVAQQQSISIGRLRILSSTAYIP